MKVGDKVRLTGKFLKSTGQVAGWDGQSRWTVLAVETVKSGPFMVTVDEKHDPDYVREVWGDLPEAERPVYRRILSCNLQVIGAKPKASDYP